MGNLSEQTGLPAPEGLPACDVTQEHRTLPKGGNTDFVISLMEPADLPEVLVIEQETYSLPWSGKTFRDALQQEYYHFLKVRCGEELAGYCGYLRSFETADVTNVTVRKDFRRRGVGEAMLRQLMEEGRRDGIERFSLEVRSSNTAAIRLYDKLGFRQEGVRRGYYENPREDALILWTPELTGEDRR